MIRRSSALWSVCSAALLSLAATSPVFAEESKAKGLGDPGAIQGLRIEPNLDGGKLVIRSRDGRQQLIVTGEYSSGQLIDHTRKVTYAAEPAGVVNIDATGLVTPIMDGAVTVTTTDPSGKSATVRIEVTGVANELPINFTNQIVPIFTKLGCNSGGCHGKATGQNGFKLSLLGFYPDEDYEYLVKEGRGRRLFPGRPAKVCSSPRRSASRPTAVASGWKRTATNIA